MTQNVSRFYMDQAGSRRRLPLPAVLPALIGALLAVWPGVAQAAAAGAQATTQVASAAVVKGKAADSDELEPIFGLPLIFVRVLENDGSKSKAMYLKVDLIFDEVDRGRIENSMSVAKSLLPRIMDSVITGIQGKRFDRRSDPEAVDKAVLRYSNAVLNPYGVVVKALNVKHLDMR